MITTKAPKTSYECSTCGHTLAKWVGKCPNCNAWNSMVETLVTTKTNQTISNLEVFSLSSPIEEQIRIPTNLHELDRVLGGGAILGAAVLIAGDPGIGKSTLLLQIAEKLNFPCLYISAEESVDQIKLRAQRLGIISPQINLVANNNLKAILHLVERIKPKVLILDSIQTIYSDDVPSVPGTVSQVRVCTNELVNACKKTNTILFIVSHITKEGLIAGPKTLEHMVDTVLSFEGDRDSDLRILRSLKNRFGPTNEIGIFEMTTSGLQQIKNPSALFLSEERDCSGTAVFPSIEGTRPLLVDIQSLVAKSHLPMPRRGAVGWDLNRLATIIAVLNTRGNFNLENREIYLNIAGGLKIQEPASDLAVAAALISAALDTTINRHTVICGEIGLSGAIRRIPHLDKRLKEAQKLGFKQAIIPSCSDNFDSGLITKRVKHIKDLIELLR